MSNPLTSPVAEPHQYLSTGCFHGDHTRCNSAQGSQARKRPASCTVCDAKCVCPCHAVIHNAPAAVGAVEV